MKLFSRGDGEGFVAAFVNNLVQLLILAPLCTSVLGFSPGLIYGRILPGVAISFLVGNLYYAWQALALAKRENREDVCALPFGISTPGLFAHIFLVMLPAKQLALAEGIADPERFAWQAGLVACFLGGVLEFGCAFFAAKIRQHTPQAAMLATLGGVGLGFLGLAFLFQAFASPVVGLVSLALVFVVFFGRMKFRGGVPATIVVLAVGTALAWITGLAPVGGPKAAPLAYFGLYGPKLALGDLWAAFAGAHFVAYLSVVIPIGLLGVLASLQNIESAAAAGDEYPVRPSLVVNGLATLAAACFGSPFPTSIYIGHPAWKKIGSRAGYSVLNGIGVTLVCITGTMAALTWLIPAEAGIAIILWIGVIIAAQAFEVTPKRHMVAVVIGLFPGLAAWTMLIVKSTLGAAGAGGPGGPVLALPLVRAAHAAGAYLGGGFALEQGFLYSAMIWASIVVYVVDRQWTRAAVWSGVGALLSLSGLMHSYILTGRDTVLNLPILDWLDGRWKAGEEMFPAGGAALGYALAALLFVIVKYIAVPSGAGEAPLEENIPEES
jgi:AGZA family xanthine/uracil permease-like MFS transporter